MIYSSVVHHANVYKGYKIFDDREGKGSFTHSVYTPMSVYTLAADLLINNLVLV